MSAVRGGVGTRLFVVGGQDVRSEFSRTADSAKRMWSEIGSGQREANPALRVLSAEFRNERMMRAEEKAARLPAIMTIPLILFILPVLFVVILGPAACSISDTLINKKPGS